VDGSWVWEVSTEDACHWLVGVDGAEGATRSIGFLGPEGVVVSAGAGGVRLELPGRPGTPAFLPMPGTTDAAVAPDGSAVFTSGESGALRWPARRPSPGVVRLGPPEPLRPLAGFPTGRVRVARGGRALAAVVDDERGRVRVLDLDGRAPPVDLAGHPNVQRLDLSPDGRWLATGTWQGTHVKVWDVGRGALARTLPVAYSAEVVFSPDSRTLLTATGAEYAVWEVGTWRPRLRVVRSQSGGLPGVAAFSPDGRLIALARTRSTVQVVDAGTGRERATLEAPEPRNVSGLGFSPDGLHLAVAFTGPRILVWDLDALRRGLGALGLDWPLPHGPAAATRPRPLTVVVESAPWLAALERGEALARSGRWDEAAAAIDEAIAAGAPHASLRVRRALLFHARGDESAYRGACLELLRTFEAAGVAPDAANDIAWACALGAGAVDDYEPLIRLAGSAVAGRHDPARLNTLGAILYRAGRFAESVRQLERAVAARGGGGSVHDALFLAMAHHRLGHGDEARSWLRRANSPPPVAAFRPDPAEGTLWHSGPELDLLRREAAATVGSLGP
jgi:hypothetical protein